MKKLRFLLFAALAVLLLGFFVRTYNHAVLLPDFLQGTYVAGNGPFQVIFSANMAREMFFYTDRRTKPISRARSGPRTTAPISLSVMIRTAPPSCRTRRSAARI